MSTADEARTELVDVLIQHPWLVDQKLAGWPKGFCPRCDKVIEAGHNSPAHAEHLADAILAAGYRKVEAAPSDTDRFKPTHRVRERGTEAWIDVRADGTEPQTYYDRDGTTIYAGIWFQHMEVEPLRVTIIRNAVWKVLWNASNYPRKVTPHMLGQDITPLRDKVTDAVVAALGGGE